MSINNRDRNGADMRNQRQIEADIHHTRDRLDETLAALEQRLSPRHLIDETLDYFRHGGPGEFAQNLGGMIKNNPTPFLLSVVGLGWLFYSQQRSAGDMRLQDDPAVAPAGEQTDRRSGRFRAARDRTQSTARRARSGMHDAGDAVRDRSARMRDGSQNALRGASAGARSAGSQAAYFVEDNPLAAAAIGIGVGAAIGALFPASRLENEQLSDMRDDLMDRAGRAGAEQADRLESRIEEKTGESPSHQRASGTGTSAHETDDSSHRARDSADHANDNSDDFDRGSSNPHDSRAIAGDTERDRHFDADDRPRDDLSRDQTHGSASATRSSGRSASSDTRDFSDAPPPGARRRPGE